MSGQRQKNRPEQEVLAFPVEGRSDAPKAAEKGTETLVAKRKTESLAGTERLMEEVCELENCKQAYNESRPTKGDGSGQFSLSAHPYTAIRQNHPLCECLSSVEPQVKFCAESVPE